MPANANSETNTFSSLSSIKTFGSSVKQQLIKKRNAKKNLKDTWMPLLKKLKPRQEMKSFFCEFCKKSVSSHPTPISGRVEPGQAKCKKTWENSNHPPDVTENILRYTRVKSHCVRGKILLRPKFKKAFGACGNARSILLKEKSLIQLKGYLELKKFDFNRRRHWGMKTS